MRVLFTGARLADAKLIADCRDTPILKDGFEEFRAAERMPIGVLEGGNDLFGFGVDYVGRVAPGKPAIETEGNPPVTPEGKVDICFLHRRHHRRVEDVKAFAALIAQPELAFIGG